MEQAAAMVQVVFWGAMMVASVVAPVAGWVKLEIGRGNL